MKVKIVFDFDLEDRLAVSRNCGEDKPASHGDMKTYVRAEVEQSIFELKDRDGFQADKICKETNNAHTR